MTEFSLIPLLEAGEAGYALLRDMPSENGYANPAHGMEWAEYRVWAAQGGAVPAAGEEGEIPVESYFLMHRGRPVASGRLRLRLNEDLQMAGGHIAYAVPEALRGRGYGQMLLYLLVQKAAERGLNRVLVTIFDHNHASIRVAEKCGGVLAGRRPGWCYYEIDAARPLMDARICAEMETHLGIRVLSARPVLGGFMNAKWRVRTSAGPLFVKQYSLTRFSPERLENLNFALKHQLQASRSARAARLIAPDGRPMFNPARGVYFILMRQERGRTMEAGALTCVQARALGQTCARLHRVMRPLPGEAPAGDLLNEAALEENCRRLEHLASQWPEDARLSALAAAQRAVLGRVPPPIGGLGIAHRDFTADNVLMDGRGVCAVLDFDRSGAGAPMLDMARAVMSFCFDGEKIDRTLVHALMRGYRSRGKCSRRDLVGALRLLCRVETLYWLTPERLFCEQAPKVRRFMREIEFLCLHYDELERMVF
jgi:homoserine kinase type II